MSEPFPDDLDREIIRALESDGRRPFREIARSLGVSEATIRARFRRLSETGTLKVVAFSDPAATSRERLALLFVRVTPEQHDTVAAVLAGRPEVSYVSSVLGAYDLFAQILVRDDAELWDFVQHQVRTLPGVVETSCTLEIRVHKLWFEHPTAPTESGRS